MIIPFYFIFHLLFSIASDIPAHYYPLDDIAVNCGGSGYSTALDGRQWIGDIKSNYVVSRGSSSKVITSVGSDKPLDPFPYMTARISRREFSYEFQVNPGQKFVRLHFYPSPYPGFESSDAFFTVEAGPYTLLRNFSPSLTADALGLPYFAKEFVVNIEENQPLFITFSPSPAGTSNGQAYAFINGIEVVSMPPGLYHTHEGDPGVQVVGKNYNVFIDRSTALEMVHRLNVGGSSIASIEDTGMFREWSKDSNYMIESKILQISTSIRIKYTNAPAYIAPQKVYQTSWSMVLNQQAKKAPNFTWKLPVDLGFRYLVRFHFCELEYEIKESGQREFSIMINNRTAEVNADVIKWSGGNGIAVYRDYIVMMEGDRREGKRDLLIVICAHKNHNYERIENVDSLLKGLEVFKLSNTDNNLAGVNPTSPNQALILGNNDLHRVAFAWGGNFIATCVVILLALLNVIVYQLRILGESKKDTSSLSSEGLCRWFSFVEVQAATNNFDDGLVIGRGGFGNVYKGLIDSGATTVAIKRLNSQSKQGADEFWTEIKMLSKLRHANLVSLIGYCNEFQEMILVYEYMKHGTLAYHLYKTNSSGNDNGGIYNMTWEQRLTICIGAASGLDYLHTGTRHGVIHRDVKTTNILLDEDWTAKISDFGLCKMGTTGHSHTHVSTDVKGTFGYLDPEYFLTRRLTKKSDVYALGVVLLEVLCGRPAVDLSLEEEQRSLVMWVQHCIKEENLAQIIDPCLRDKISSQSLKVFAEVAKKCLHNSPNRRPTVADVVVTLECALASQCQCQESSLKAENIFTVSSSLTQALNGKNTPQGEKRTKGELSKILRKIAFLAKDGTKIIGNNKVSCTNTSNDTCLKGKTLDTPNLRIFTFAELKKAARNFRLDGILGEGSFGRVYKGWLDEKGSRTVIAIKRLQSQSMRGLTDWQTEIKFLKKFSHPNLVKLMGHCRDHEELLLVYQFMENGSLDNQIFGRSVQPLPWETRLKILTGAARGLAFLHTSEERVTHGNFHVGNILLDESFNAKISGFSLAKWGPEDGESYMETRVVGTYGFVAPEYIVTGHLYVKSDVYGFGVVLVEMLTGLRALDAKRRQKQHNLIDWAKPYPLDERKLKNVMDSRLEGKYPSVAALQLAQLATKCLLPEPTMRPSMMEVVEILQRVTETENEKTGAYY